MIPRLAVIVSAAVLLAGTAFFLEGCFPYNWHEQELRKADDLLQACRQSLEQAQASCQEYQR